MSRAIWRWWLLYHPSWIDSTYFQTVCQLIPRFLWLSVASFIWHFCVRLTQWTIDIIWKTSKFEAAGEDTVTRFCGWTHWQEKLSSLSRYKLIPYFCSQLLGLWIGLWEYVYRFIQQTLTEKVSGWFDRFRIRDENFCLNSDFLSPPDEESQLLFVVHITCLKMDWSLRVCLPVHTADFNRKGFRVVWQI